MGNHHGFGRETKSFAAPSGWRRLAMALQLANGQPVGHQRPINGSVHDVDEHLPLLPIHHLSVGLAATVVPLGFAAQLRLVVGLRLCGAWRRSSLRRKPPCITRSPPPPATRQYLPFSTPLCQHTTPLTRTHLLLSSLPHPPPAPSANPACSAAAPHDAIPPVYGAAGWLRLSHMLGPAHDVWRCGSSCVATPALSCDACVLLLLPTPPSHPADIQQKLWPPQGLEHGLLGR